MAFHSSSQKHLHFIIYPFTFLAYTVQKPWGRLIIFVGHSYKIGVEKKEEITTQTELALFPDLSFVLIYNLH